MQLEMREYSSWIGISTAITGNTLISLALNIQKYSHCKIKERNENSDEYTYLDDPIWWIGMILLFIGEVGNFIAYSFASAAIVAPLGTVALIANTIFAPLILKETFRRRDFVGVVFAVSGAILVVFSSKVDETKIDCSKLLELITQTKFILYLVASISIASILISFNEKIGPKFILIDMTIVGIAAGFTVLATKSISSLLSSHSLGMFSFGMSYIIIVVLIGSGILQIRYLNKAMARFESTQVVPIQFVFFTLFAIVGSAILFNDFEGFSSSQYLLFLFGCASIFSGVYFITSNRDIIINLDAIEVDLPSKPLDISFDTVDYHSLHLARHRIAAKSMDGLGLLTTGLGNQSVRYALDHSNSAVSRSLPKYPVQL